MRINRSEELKSGILHSIRKFIGSFGRKNTPLMHLPLPDQFTLVTEKFDVVHRPAPHTTIN
jgi:hypothetical protein